MRSRPMQAEGVLFEEYPPLIENLLGSLVSLYSYSPSTLSAFGSAT